MLNSGTRDGSLSGGTGTDRAVQRASDLDLRLYQLSPWKSENRTKTRDGQRCDETKCSGKLRLAVVSVVRFGLRRRVLYPLSYGRKIGRNYQCIKCIPIGAL